MWDGRTPHAISSVNKIEVKRLVFADNILLEIPFVSYIKATQAIHQRTWLKINLSWGMENTLIVSPNTLIVTNMLMLTIINVVPIHEEIPRQVVGW